MPVVLITGASRGIGLEFARQYARDGWDVIATCRRPAEAVKLQALAKEHKNIRIETLDVIDGQSIAALAAKLKDAAIDLLINNAGVPRSGKASSPGVDNYYGPEEEFENLDAEEWIGAIRVNAVAPVMITRAFAPNLARGHEKKTVMLSSRYGSISMNRPDLLTYSTSKAALNMAMRKLALFLQPRGIAVASLHPGWAQTDMGGSNADVPVVTSVSGMRKVIAGLTLEKTGQFFDYDGKSIPW
jgi:NAD(P)-dependent dehydrogenase (short-subunit alcohol dehydrogenase family)